MRADGRKDNQLRTVELIPEVARYAEGSVEVRFGHTRVFCTATVENTAPKWLQGTGQGWVTAEYGMLPRSTHTRMQREKAANSGRTQEISRLIGRSLRAAVDLKALGERQVMIDCDVLQADGGTRTAAVTGGFVALAFALKFMKDRGDIKTLPLKHYVAAISVGMQGPKPILDLCYDEDFACSTDMNFVMTSRGDFVEIQGTAEGEAFSREQMNAMTELADVGCRELFRHQSELIKNIFPL
ncbi:MAG: ribonuclease PH [Bdellovibrionales bacterium]